MKITIRLIALVIIGSLMSTGVSAQNIPNADNEYEALMQKIRLDFAKNPSIDKDLKTYNEGTVHSQMWITPVLNEPTGHQ